MRITIPDIGTKLELTKKWVFNIYPESRNKKLYTKLGYQVGVFKDNNTKYFFIKPENVKPYIKGSQFLHTDCSDMVHKTLSCELGIGVILIVDRIYIRKGMEDFSSITFKIEGGKYDKCRFWVKLKYVNQIEFSLPKQEHRIKYGLYLDMKNGKVISLFSLEKYIVGDNKIAIYPIKIHLNGTSDKVCLKQQIKFRDLTNDEFIKSKYPKNIYGKVALVEDVKFIGYDLVSNGVIFESKTLATAKKKIKKFCNDNY